MAKAKSKDQAPELSVHSLVDDLLGELAKEQTSGKTITAADLGQHTWGVQIPHIAFQWLIGGSDKLPAQRYIGISGLQKSMKSTLLMDIGSWYMAAGGWYVDIDNEGKTSDTMFDAMTNWRKEQLSRGRHTLSTTASIEEWQSLMTKIIAHIRKLGVLAKGKRIPLFIGLDSLTGKGMAASSEKIMDEGHSQARSYDAAAAANMVTQFIQNLNLRGTTVTVGMIRHLVTEMGDGGPAGPQQKEAGAKRVNFQHSINLRCRRAPVQEATIDKAGHPAQFMEGPAVEGYTIRVTPEASCIGPIIGRYVDVDVIWQLVPTSPDGQVSVDGGPLIRRQSMKWDWDGALGRLLHRFKYSTKDEEKLCQWERELLDQALMFVAGPGKTVKCDALGLPEPVGFTAFGAAIRNSPEASKRIQNFLGIHNYPDIQEAEIEPEPEAE